MILSKLETDKNEKTQLQTRRYYDSRKIVRDEKYPVGSTVLLTNYANVSNIPKSFKSTFSATPYIIESRHGVTYWLKQKDKPDAPLKIAHHNQIRKLDTKTDEEQEKINLRDRTRRPMRLGYPLENEEENTV